MKRWLETRAVMEQLAAWQAARRPCALATVVRVRGSAYRHEGAKLLVASDGESVGNVSGGCLEEDVREVALRVIASGKAERRSYCGGTNEIAAWDLGVGCEGEVEILVERVGDARRDEREMLASEEEFVVLTSLERGTRRVLSGAETVPWISGGDSRIAESPEGPCFVDVLRPPPRLLIVSAGDDARRLAAIAAGVGFRVVVADRRPGLLASDAFPSIVRLVETDAARLSERVVLDEASFAVVMTHHFADDTDYLRALVRSPARYLGVLGPRQRTERILGALRTEGLTVDDARIFGPVGLDIGTDGAEQVAIAVVAEMLAVRSGRRPRSLRERATPIHTDVDPSR